MSSPSRVARLCLQIDGVTAKKVFRVVKKLYPRWSFITVRNSTTSSSSSDNAVVDEEEDQTHHCELVAQNKQLFAVRSITSALAEALHVDEDAITSVPCIDDNLLKFGTWDYTKGELRTAGGKKRSADEDSDSERSSDEVLIQDVDAYTKEVIAACMKRLIEATEYRDHLENPAHVCDQACEGRTACEEQEEVLI